jgi:hypothetical protein
MKVSHCNACASFELLELSSEACLHFPGLQGLKVEPILVYPKIVVCTECGFVQLRLSDRELEKVKEDAAKTGIRGYVTYFK